METYRVSLAVSKRIKTAQDLSDFYSFVESEIDKNATYQFTKKEEKRLFGLAPFVSYVAGKYDKQNASRIFGGALKYEMAKRQTRQKAIDWQIKQSNANMSYAELVKAQEHFAKLGKRYGLMKEFRENAIL